MKLDRNINPDGKGKYALIKLREVTTIGGSLERMIIHPGTAIDFGNTEDSDFFVIRLKDKYAGTALFAYAQQAEKDDPEYAQEIYELAKKAHNHPNQKQPD